MLTTIRIFSVFPFPPFLFELKTHAPCLLFQGLWHCAVWFHVRLKLYLQQIHRFVGSKDSQFPSPRRSWPGASQPAACLLRRGEQAKPHQINLPSALWGRSQVSFEASRVLLDIVFRDNKKLLGKCPDESGVSVDTLVAWDTVKYRC